MNTNRNITLAGSAMLVVGLFCPIVTLPFLGNVNLFNNGSNVIALALLALAAIAGAMALNGRVRDAFWPGIAAAVILIYHFVVLQYRLSEIRENMAELEGNPFAKIAQAAVGSIQLQWGWLILAAGVGVLIYEGSKARRQEELSLFSAPDGPAKTVTGASALMAAAVIGWSLFGQSLTSGSPTQSAGRGSGSVVAAGITSSDPKAVGPSVEKVSYIKQHLRLYDLEARYYDSMLDGRVPGVDFKIKNNGNRTLNKVTVRVIFHDKDGNAIAEEEYNPVRVSEYSMGNSDMPLRPNYIWQNEPDRFYSAKRVPSEWVEGKATASIIDIEFDPTS